MSKKSLLALAVGAFLIPACGQKGDLPEIKVGVIAELSGDLSGFGDSCKKAAELKAAEIDAKGGIDVGGTRYRLRLIIDDSQGKAEQAVAAAQRLVSQDGVVAFVGPNISLCAVPVADEAEKVKVPMISASSTAPKTTLDATTGQPKQWVFRASFTDAWQGQVLAKFADGYIRARKAAVLYDPTSEAPKIQAELFKQDFEKSGGQVVAFETFKSGETDFKAAFDRIKKAGPDVVFLPGYYADVARQLPQARKAGLSVPCLGSDNWGITDLLLKAAGADAEGSFYCAHYNPGARNEITGTFVASYKKRYADATPDDVGALTYDALGLLEKALKASGKPDRQAVRDALAKIAEYDGVTGKLRFKEGSRDPVKSAVMMKIEKGKPLFVTNIDPESK